MWIRDKTEEGPLRSPICGSEGHMVSAESRASWASQNRRGVGEAWVWWGVVHALGQSEEPGLPGQQVHFFQRPPTDEWESLIHSALIYPGW